MYLGLDVGGTHTDAVLLDEKGVKSTYKAVTDHANLLLSVQKALQEVTKNINPKDIRRINLSTTLSTNAIVENRIEDVGVFVSSGPGIDPESFRIGESYFVLDGSIDHRGTVVKAIEDVGLERALAECKKKGIKVFAAVTKFSTRNPGQERKIEEKLKGISDFTTLGHRLSGQLGFPRRVATAYFNSATWRIFRGFADAIEKGIRGLGIEAEINILKADGGTMPLSMAHDIPVESILSGPAASVMGIISLCHITEDSIILDIGGTTTDIAIFASGAPLIEREGISLASHPTLVRSLKTKSIGMGGDSALTAANGIVKAGPERRGPAMADGGDQPTLIDALNYKGIIDYNDKGRSVQGIEELAKKSGLSPKKLADAAVEYALGAIKSAVDVMLTEINEKPVYTIHEMIEGKRIVPSRVYCMGGPARAFMELLSDRFSINVTVPKNYEVANAIGAALAKNTFEVELFADTSNGVLTVPNLNITMKVTAKYDLGEAERDAKKFLAEHLKSLGVSVDDKDMEITEASSFKMVQGFSSVGKDIRVKCQIRPGVVMDLTE